MSLLTLQGIGKIYVSEGSVAVGIRGVDLSFDKGEFVAVTGQSGSGKSTLLNVISGMDSYEEGEMYVEGQPTSHYLQPDWEEYRKQYISFIFQDYNIIESFTVLQNVELALMHIDDKAERRRRALELIDRVGLSRFVRQKGSKLSGGQKQRTVIARALAKDSPIILADEPTGNLDSETSREIIQLLREVSRDKLLIIVTHNYEQVEEYATRHIRVFDGAIESDHTITAPKPAEEAFIPEKNTEKYRTEAGRNLANGITLGKTIFKATPKLSVFMCFLLLIGTLGLFLVSSLFGDASELYEKHYMFTRIDGRLIVTEQNGSPITEEEIAELSRLTGADGILHYDIMLDENWRQRLYIQELDNWESDVSSSLFCNYLYGKKYSGKMLGGAPEKSDEVFLYLPISYRPYFGKTEILIPEVSVGQVKYRVSGVKYYYDNNKTAEIMFTEEGFRNATAQYYFSGDSGRMRWGIELVASLKGMEYPLGTVTQLVVSSKVPEGKAYLFAPGADKELSVLKNEYGADITVNANFVAKYAKYNYLNYDRFVEESVYELSFDEYLTEAPMDSAEMMLLTGGNDTLIISPSLQTKISEEILKDSYRQVSFFYGSDGEAAEAAELMKSRNFVAVPSDTTYVPDVVETVIATLTALGLTVALILTIVFLAFFINLCSSRSIAAFKGDLAIMRSMGIPAKVIRIGMYVRMFISLIPSYIIVAVTAAVIFLTPKFNEYFVFLHWWQYALIFFGMLLLTWRVTHKQIKKLFGESVKSSLRGGSAE